MIEDCLGYRVRERHDEALRQLVEIMEAKVLTCRKALDVLRHPELAEVYDSGDDSENDDEDEEEVRNEEAFDDTNTTTDTSARLHDLLAADSDDGEDDQMGELDLIRVRCTRLAS